MNKKLLSVFFAALMIAMMAVVASATVAFDFTVEEGTLSNAGADSTGVYKIVGTVKDNVGVFGSIHVTATFDNSIIIPVSAKSGAEANISAGSVNTPFVYPSVLYYDEDNEEDVTETALRTTGYPKWAAVADTTDYEVQYEAYTATKLFDADNLVLFEMYFKLAEGKTLEDIKEEDFVIGWMFYSNGEAGGHYANDEDESKNDIAVVNNVVNEEAPATKLTISVAAGDVVYFQDGTSAVVAEANEAYEIPADDGTVVVNSVDEDGYQTAQKVYTVADGAVTEDAAKADGVIATGEASIRNDTTASGIRYKSTFLTSLKDVVAEYGYITTVESAYNKLPEDYVLNMDLVASGKAVQDIAYDGETDIFWNVEDDKTVVTAVVTGVPMTKDGVTTNVVIRPYYTVNGITVYGEPMTRTVYEVALNIKTNDAETYAKYQDYIDEIIALVDGTDTDIVIDFGPLFK